MKSMITPEKTLYTNSNFPFSLVCINNNTCTPPTPACYYLHWHDELEFIVVTKGSLSMMVNGTTYDLKQHQALFINRGLLHMTKSLSEDGEYLSFTFSSTLLSTLHGSQLESDFVHRFTKNYDLPGMILTKESDWQQTIISMLLDLASFCLEDSVYGKEYEIALRLQSLWLVFIRHRKEDSPVSSKTFIRKLEAMQTMLSFIHEHYMEDLSLANIYETVQISQAECCRLFKQFLSISPYDYLIRYRFYKSMDLLNETDLPVAEIAARVGFKDCSHFIQQFKRFTTLTPKAYRNRLV